jgi:oxalate decarboxylase family bicupin protein
MGPRNPARERQNPDLIRPPSTDHGAIPNMRWSFADSHVRIEEGGWTRETTVRELGTSKELAGVNMRLDEGVIRELHWHKEAEWAYVLEGKVRITALDTEGGSFVDDLEKGDLWYFPSGHPHSLQGLSPNGTEFLLIFDDGNFSEDSTFLLTDWMRLTPKSVLGENFRVAPEVFKAIPEKEKYIFQGSLPDSIEKEIPSAGKGYKKSKVQFTHKMLAQEPVNTTGGQVRITDSLNFPISKTIAAAHLNIQPGAIREMHWHRKFFHLRSQHTHVSFSSLTFPTSPCLTQGNSQRRRMVLLHKRPRARHNLRCKRHSAHFRLPSRRRGRNPAQHGPLHREPFRRRRSRGPGNFPCRQVPGFQLVPVVGGDAGEVGERTSVCE